MYDIKLHPNGKGVEHMAVKVWRCCSVCCSVLEGGQCPVTARVWGHAGRRVVSRIRVAVSAGISVVCFHHFRFRSAVVGLGRSTWYAWFSLLNQILLLIIISFFRWIEKQLLGQKTLVTT